jgi:hypothetical protein
VTSFAQALVPRRLRAALRERDQARVLDLLPRSLRRDGLVVLRHVREGRFQRSLALVAAGAAVLGGIEVTYEHYRGSYGNPLMYTPVALTPPLVAAGVWCTLDRRAARLALPVASLAVIADGVLGFVFHVRGIARKPGGFRIPIFNVIMGPPIFAPLLFAVPGYLGVVASALRREDDPRGRSLPWFARPRPVWLEMLPARVSRRGVTLWHEVREGRFQKHVAGAAAAASFFSGVEALYSHYKNAFRHWSQWTPVVLAPALTAAGVGAIASREVARTALPIAASLAIADGVLGFFYHARGVVRRPGGTKMPLYNLMYGPPIFAPLLLAAAGSMGLLASLLRRER